MPKNNPKDKENHDIGVEENKQKVKQINVEITKKNIVLPKNKKDKKDVMKKQKKGKILENEKLFLKNLDRK